MNGRKIAKYFLKQVLPTVLALLCFSILPAAAAGPVGAAFSDPTVKQEMSDGWRAKGIEHGPGLEKVDMVVSINQQFHELLAPVLSEFAGREGIHLEIVKGTCGSAAGMLLAKKGDAGMFCCPAGDTDRLPDLTFHTLGIHPVAVLVHPDNPVAGVTFSQLQDLFMGTVDNWKELGWRDLLIQPVARLHCRNRPGHWRLLLENEDVFSPYVREVGAIDDMFRLVSSMPSAIGYEILRGSEALPGKTRTMRIDGVEASDLGALAQGTYPLYRLVNFATWEKGIGHSKSELLIDYLRQWIEEFGEEESIVSVSRLRKAGWRFQGAELVGEPER